MHQQGAGVGTSVLRDKDALAKVGTGTPLVRDGDVPVRDEDAPSRDGDRDITSEGLGRTSKEWGTPW